MVMLQAFPVKRRMPHVGFVPVPTMHGRPCWRGQSAAYLELLKAVQLLLDAGFVSTRQPRPTHVHRCTSSFPFSRFALRSIAATTSSPRSTGRAKYPSTRFSLGT